MNFRKFVGNGKQIKQGCSKKIIKQLKFAVQMFDILMRRGWNSYAMILDCQERRIVTSKSYRNCQNQIIWIWLLNYWTVDILNFIQFYAKIYQISLEFSNFIAINQHIFLGKNIME